MIPSQLIIDETEKQRERVVAELRIVDPSADDAASLLSEHEIKEQANESENSPGTH